MKIAGLIGLIFSVVFLLFSTTQVEAACPGNLDDVIDSPSFGYEISYTNDNTDSDFFPDLQAQRVSDSLDAHHQRLWEATNILGQVVIATVGAVLVLAIVGR